jgi:hypothetical protein
MRTVQEILLQPMPPDAALSDLAEELAVVGVEAAKGQLFVARLTELLADHPTLAQLMAMSASEVKAVEAAVKFSVCDSTSLRICLGSATSPFTFKPDVVTSHPSGEALTTLTVLPQEQGTTLTVLPQEQGTIKSKGGSLKAVGGQLQVRRDPLLEYYPPCTFDIESKGNPLRSMKRLRMKIVKEIEDNCGDLYPSKEERDTILTAIQNLCGPPDTAPSWNYYYTFEGNRKVKHKGTSISDLEKARPAPAQWGCHGQAVEGQMRPTRPVRSQTAQMSGAQMSGTSPQVLAPPPQVSAEAQQGKIASSAKNGEPEVNADLSDLMTEADLMKNVSAAADAVAAMQQGAAKEKEAKKEAAAAMRKAKAEAKAEAKAAAPPKSTGRTRKENPEAPNPNPSKKAKRAPALTEYEVERNARMAQNKQWITFIEKTMDEGLKILEVEEALTVLGTKDGATLVK